MKKLAMLLVLVCGCGLTRACYTDGDARDRGEHIVHYCTEFCDAAGMELFGIEYQPGPGGKCRCVPR